MATLRDILKLDTTPAANEVQCEWGTNHSLKPAQEAAHTMLNHRDHWKQVMA
ncbi:S-ribosylhomocysteine lyase [Cutibacterium acnes JCM 18909]|nr:S-ribosylhomocysteine lyase [Cutibacterium acnes JCM 18909]